MSCFRLCHFWFIRGNLLLAVLILSRNHEARADSAAASPNEPAVEKVALGKIRNLSIFSDAVYLSGQPSSEDFKLLAERGVKVVVNLRRPEEMKALRFDEAAAVETAGMRYVHIPVDNGPPDKEAVDRLLGLLADAGENPLILHCGSANRVGYIWSIFRSAKHDIDVEKAVAEGKQVGLRNPDLETFAREYIAWLRRARP